VSAAPSSQRALRWAMLILNAIGLGVAAYLTYVHYSGLKGLVCPTGGGSCLQVQSSVWSRIDGIPVALIGLVGYVAILVSQVTPEREESRLATLGLTLIGVGFSAYLTYRELFSIHAICEWCVSSAIIMTLLFIGAAIRYVLAPTAEAPGGGLPEQPVRPPRARRRAAAARR
jgi:uncharacterized membrane protein